MHTSTHMHTHMQAPTHHALSPDVNILCNCVSICIVLVLVYVYVFCEETYLWPLKLHRISYQYLNPLHTNGFIHLVSYNEPRMVHQGQKYFNIALVLQDERLTIFTRPANACTCPIKAYTIKNITE